MLLRKTALFLSLLAPAAVFGQSKYSNDFLNTGFGARGLAMGSSVVASSKDVTAGYWNPAGLTSMENDRQLTLMHSEYFGGVANYDFGALGFRLGDKSAASLSFVRFGVDDIPNTLSLIDPAGNINYSKVSSFSASDIAVLASFGHDLNDDLSLGGSFKIIRRKVGDFGGAWGFGIDLGARYTKDNWKFAAAIRDASTTVNFWSYTNSPQLVAAFALTGNAIPSGSTEITRPRIIGGAGYLWEIAEDYQLYTEVNLDITTDGRRNTLIRSNPFSIDPKMGFEFGYAEMFFFRAGINNLQQQTVFDVSNVRKKTTLQPNLGLGIKLNRLRIDYAFTNVGDQSSFYSHVFSLSLGFDQK